jgi:hypothetical protein
MLQQPNKVARRILSILAFAVLIATPGTVSAQAPASSKPNCLLKYDTLSSLMCETEKKATSSVPMAEKHSTEAPSAVVMPFAQVMGETSSATVATDGAKEASSSATPEKESFIREMKGIKWEYNYTDRVSKDKESAYTKMREKPDIKSERREMLRPGDKVRIIPKEKDAKKGWYYVQVFKSKDEKVVGKEGWIESWLVDDVNVPKEPTPTPSPTSSPDAPEGEANASVAPGSSGGEAMWGMINGYRTSNGLPAFEKSGRLCSIAAERAPEIAGNAASGDVHSGFRARGLGYPVAIENAVAMGSLEANFNWWINSSLHRGSILGPDLKYSCVECSGGSCVQIFSPNP